MGTFLGVSGWLILACGVSYAAGIISAVIGKPLVAWATRKVLQFTEKK